MHQRHHRLAYTVCGVLVAIGLIALNFPVFLDAYDQWGFQIKCGTGYATDLTQAAAVAGQHNYVDKCETALLARRMWAIPLRNQRAGAAGGHPRVGDSVGPRISRAESRYGLT